MTHFHCKYKNSNFEVKSHTVKEQNSQTQTRENTKHSLHQKSHEAKKKKKRVETKPETPTLLSEPCLTLTSSFLSCDPVTIPPLRSIFLLKNLHQLHTSLSLSLSLSSVVVVPAAMFCGSKRNCSRWIFYDLTVMKG